MQLSPNFTLAEMIRTSQRAWIGKNNPTKLQIETGKVLCTTLLEPIRAHFGRPVMIHSGYRCPGLNDAIGGSRNSQHMKFEAADFHVSGVSLEEVFEWIWKESGLHWGQLILEGYAKGKPSWIHLSLGSPYRRISSCMQVKKMEGRQWTTLQ